MGTENLTLKSATRALLYVTCVCSMVHSSCHFMLSLPKSSMGNYISSTLIHHTHTSPTITNKHHPWITLFLLLFFCLFLQKISNHCFYAVWFQFHSFVRMFRIGINKALAARIKVRRYWVTGLEKKIQNCHNLLLRSQRKCKGSRYQTNICKNVQLHLYLYIVRIVQNMYVL